MKTRVTKKTESRVLWTAMTFGMMAFSVIAGPLEDAKAVYGSGKYSEVDEKLGNLLEQRPVSSDILQLSFNAAYFGGRPYTAERRYNDIVAKGDKIPNEILFRAAMVSGQVGKPNIRRDRLIFFLKNDTGWNADVETALLFLCRDGGDGEHFERLMQKAGATEPYFELGLDMLEQMRQAKRVQDFRKVASTLLLKYKDVGHQTRVMNASRVMMAGCSPEARVGIFSSLIQADVGKNPEFISLARMWNEFGPQHVIEYTASYKTLLPIDLFERITKPLKGAVGSDEERRALAQKFKAFQGLVVPAKEATPAQKEAVADYLQAYLGAVFANQELLFRERASVRFSQADIATMFWNVASVNGKKENVEPLRKLAAECVLNKGFPESHEKNIIQTFPNLFDYRALFYNSKVAENARKTKKGDEMTALLAKIPDRFDIRKQCLPVYWEIGDVAMMKKLTEEQILLNPLDFDSDNIARYFLSTDVMSAADRANFLKGLLLRTGYSEAWRRLISFGALPASLREDATYKAFVEMVKPETKGNDVLLGAVTELAQVKTDGNGKLPAEAFTLAKKAIDACGGKIPNGNIMKSVPAQRAWTVATAMARTNEDKEKLFKLFAPSFQKGADFAGLISLATATQNPTNYMAAVRVAVKMGGLSADTYKDMTYPKNFPTSILAESYKDMSPYAVVDHVNKNLNNWAPAETFKQIGLMIQSRPMEEFDVDSMVRTLSWVESTLTATNLYDAAALPVLEVFAKTYIDERKGNSAIRGRVAKCFGMLDKTDAIVARYLAASAKADPVIRYTDIWVLADQAYVRKMTGANNWIPLITLEKESVGSEQVEPGARDFGTVLRNHLLPAIKAIPMRQAGLLLVTDSNRYTDLLRGVESRIANKKQKDETSAAFLSFAAEYARRLPYGMRMVTEGWRMNPIIRRGFEQFITSEKSYFDAAAVASQLGGSYLQHSDYNGANLLAALNTATEAGAWECAHIVCSAVPTHAQNASAFQRLRSDCSLHMPGIYPVDESSPMYPLYVAADELERNNPERSTILLNKNLQTFEREASKLPPNFVAWGVEQLRYQRGKEDALLLKARKIATELLSKEKTLTPELAASLMLTRAECYRDQRNYEAAKLEYQSIRNGAYYTGTQAARKAMFRDVDLLIEMGNVSQAEQIIELWLSQPDAEIQAQAHYFLARVAFDRKDFEETRKQLNEVFGLDYTHTDARLLHGQWKLATNSEVDDTDVLVGVIGDRTVIRPGQELSVTVQDKNLSVAGGGSSIPIVITTSVGKDLEVLRLFPQARDPTLFSGAISTMLGSAIATNHILEVTGSDEVSYCIEPEFLKTRGLETTPPKTLRIVDDARLAIGAAAPLAEEGKAEDALEALMMSTGAEGSSKDLLSNNLKPGNKIYVVVRDRDRSMTASEPNTVLVDARTTSGDKLEGITLSETGNSTGIFRGEIPTQLPPPRAFASDTATGSNPGDAINKKRDGIWKSAPDGKQGKWFEVDTMGSHVISNVAIMVPVPDDITSIRLTGYLSGERTVLGTLPMGDISKRYGIHYQASSGRKHNSSSLIRSEFSSDKAPAAKIVKDLAFTPVSNRDQNQNAMISAPFVLPKEQNKLRFKLEANDLKGRTLAGLWMAIAIDGVDVFSGQGNGLHEQIVELEVEPGAHLLEVFFSASYPDDALTIHVLKDDGTLQQFPEAWVDPKESPALVDFVKDVAVIHRNKSGFQATFSKPKRFRSLRWEFLGYKGREISVSKLYVQDVNGQLIIPVESDYSEALMNDTLEVAPGDNIIVSYNDDRTSSGKKKVLERQLTSSFHDARVNFFFEEIEQTRTGNNIKHFDAYRFLPGDMLLVSVHDPDGDVTPEADKVKVVIETRVGRQRAEMTLTEQENKNGGYSGANVHEGIHGGYFLGQLRTCDSTVTNVPRGTLKIAPGDVITLKYMDRENTRPGVPTERVVRVSATQPTTPHVTFFDTVVERVEDTSVDAKLRLEQIRRRPGNENIEKLYKDVITATMMTKEAMSSTNAMPFNVATPIPIMVTDPSRARHEASKVFIEVVAQSEIEDAEASARDADVIVMPLKLGINFDSMRTDAPRLNPKDAGEAGVFSGLIKMHLGPPDPGADYDEEKIPDLPVNGNDRVRIRILNEDQTVQSEHWMQLVSAARLSLMDSTYSADRQMAHIGERFFVMVQDPDQDTGDDINEVAIGVTAEGSKVTRKIVLKETLPHSGIFTGAVRPVIFAPGEDIPSVATGGVARTEAELLDDRISVRYGDTVKFVYNDKETIPSKKPGLLGVTGRVFKGSDGDVRLFSKRFRDSDMAVLVQFRLAECLFETAKEFRRLKQPDRSAEAIDQGKLILEEALRNYPTTIHLVQGEYLLANLYQELGTEQKEAGNVPASVPLFTEALSRFSAILSTWPESEFAAKAQYHKAYCLEMLGDANRASEEYVKMTYLYPESPLVGDASIRLATYYYKQNRFDTAGRIYANFQKRFPTHEKADRSLFMAAQCHMKQAEFLAQQAAKEEKKAPVLLMNEEYKRAVESLATLTEQYRETASVGLRAQAMYWAGDASLRCGDYENAYLYLKRTVFEYPETEWARRARGLLLQESKAFDRLD